MTARTSRRAESRAAAVGAPAHALLADALEALAPDLAIMAVHTFDQAGYLTGAVTCTELDPHGARATHPVPPPRDATGHAACLDDLLAALRSGRPAPTDAADNLHTLAMVYAASKSAREGRRVMLDEV
jgi:predicted dehydrogenase